MDTKLLREWLGLPPGDWPPKADVLLGGTANPQERAVSLMERLRPHQLRHPELVTEGMNRLAQALIELEKRQPPPRRESTQVELGAFTDTGAPLAEVLDAEVVEVVPFRVARRRRKRRLARQPVAAPPAILQSIRLNVGNRRSDYCRLAHLRRTLEAWKRLGASLGVPSNRLNGTLDVCLFLTAAMDYRTAMARSGRDQPDAGTAHAVATHAASLAILREMQRRQRKLLAIDWANRLAVLEGKMQGLRDALRKTKPRPTLPRRLRAARRWLAIHPEFQLAAVLLLTVSVAVARAVRLL